MNRGEKSQLERCEMRRKQFLLGAMVLLVSLLVVSCGIPQEEYDVVLAERNTALTKTESLQAEVASLQSDLSKKAESQITTLESDLSKAENDLSWAKSELSKVESDLAAVQSALIAAQNQTVDAQSHVSSLQNELAAAEAELEAVYKVILFIDDFEDGDTVGWNLEGGWSVIQEDGNYILQGIGPCSADTGSQEWTDYRLEARIKYSQSANVSFRFTPAQGTRYLLNIVPEEPILYKEPPDRRFLAQSGVSLQQNQWMDLKIEVRGNNVKIYIDRILLLTYTDDEPLPKGTIGFELPENSVLHVDDVVVIVNK